MHVLEYNCPLYHNVWIYLLKIGVALSSNKYAKWARLEIYVVAIWGWSQDEEKSLCLALTKTHKIPSLPFTHEVNFLNQKCSKLRKKEVELLAPNAKMSDIWTLLWSPISLQHLIHWSLIPSSLWVRLPATAQLPAAYNFMSQELHCCKLAFIAALLNRGQIAPCGPWHIWRGTQTENSASRITLTRFAMWLYTSWFGLYFLHIVVMAIAKKEVKNGFARGVSCSELNLLVFT